VYAKLIENWLINVNELGYQIPFCEVLQTRGFKVLYLSSHGPGEHGKDVIARDNDGQLWAFQLKGGRIRLSEWRRMQDEVRELVELPVTFPGISPRERFKPVLVTNGDITSDARDNINAYAEKWTRSGSDLLEVWSKHHLLSLFVEAHGSYLPTEVDDFRRLTELYSLDPGDRIPRDLLLDLLTQLVERKKVGTTAAQKKRALESMVLIGSYIVGQYEAIENFVSAVEGWSIVAAAVMYLVQRDSISTRAYAPSLTLIRRAFETNLARVEKDALSRPNWVEGALIVAEPAVLNARVSLVLSWIAAAALERARQGSAVDQSNRDVFFRELSNFRLLGEVDFPKLVAVVLLAEALGEDAVARSLLFSWVSALVNANTGETPPGIPSPYWEPEKVVRQQHGMLPNYEHESFGRESYTLLQALDMAVRREFRAQIAAVWRDASRVTFHDFVPDGAAWFLWRARYGNLHAIQWPQPVSWSKWRDEQQSLPVGSVPDMILRHPEWALPFALTIPHRANRGLTALIDARYQLQTVQRPRDEET